MQAKIIIGQDSYNVVFDTCEELVDRIKSAARLRGWAKIKVFLDGDPVSPATFCSKLHDGAVVTVAKYDVAGMAPEEGVWLTVNEEKEREEKPAVVIQVYGEKKKEEEDYEDPDWEDEEDEKEDEVTITIKVYRDGRVVVEPPK